jgi:hypothetical protein
MSARTMVEHDIHERAASIFVPDTMLASQYFDRVRRRKDLTGEQRLMCAIIEDAVETYLKHATASRRDLRERVAEVEHWIASTDRSWLYAFETICDYLGLDASYLRRGLGRWKDRVRETAAAAPPEPEGAETPELQRASNE